MSSRLEEVRKVLLDKVATIDDEGLLRRALAILSEYGEAESTSFICTDSAGEDSYQLMIDEAIADSEAGRVIAYDEFRGQWQSRLIDGK